MWTSFRNAIVKYAVQIAIYAAQHPDQVIALVNDVKAVTK